MSDAEPPATVVAATPPATATFVETALELRISYAEVDRMGVVYYGHYLRWFEMGRAEYIRVRGKTYRELEAEGLLLPVVEAYVRYREPAGYDELVRVWTTPLVLGPVRVQFSYRVTRAADDVLLAEGHTTHCVTGPARRPKRVPAELIALLRRAPQQLQASGPQVPRATTQSPR